MDNPANMIDFEGEKGSSLLTDFYEPSDMKRLQEFLARLTNYFEKYKKADHRALAIIGASTVENELDKFLSIWIKGYENLDLTSKKKVELAISLKLIPEKILKAIEPINKIRNIFAHDFEVDTFEQAKVKSPKAFQYLANAIKSFNCPVEDDDIKAFEYLILKIMIGLNVYAEQLVKIQDYIWNYENRNRIIIGTSPAKKLAIFPTQHPGQKPEYLK